jgi:hypothetical protein
LAGLVIGTSTSLVLVDGLHLVLPAGLQLWRVHWLAHWFAMGCIGALLFRDIEGRDVPRALLLGLSGLLVWNLTAWMWLPFILLYGCWPVACRHLRPRMKTLLGSLFAIGILALLANHVANQMISFRMAHYRLDLYAFDRTVLAFPALALGLPLLGSLAWNRLALTGRWLVVACILFPLVALGAVRWDARPPVTRAFEDNAFQTDLFGVSLPEDAQVYWDNLSLVGTWLVLHRADYLSPQQLSGLVFNRETALDAHRRLGRILPLIQESLYCQDRSVSPTEREHCHISDVNLRIACEPGPVLAPDYLVLPYSQPQRSIGRWTILDPATGQAALEYRLYSCRDLMEDLDETRAARASR